MRLMFLIPVFAASTRAVVAPVTMRASIWSHQVTMARVEAVDLGDVGDLGVVAQAHALVPGLVEGVARSRRTTSLAPQVADSSSVRSSVRHICSRRCQARTERGVRPAQQQEAVRPDRVLRGAAAPVLVARHSLVEIGRAHV